jgi:hypothetical protein
MDHDTAAVLIDRFHQDFAMVDIEEDGPKEIPPSTYKDIYDSPSSYDGAWNHPDPWQRSKWQEAISLEFKKMKDHNV